MFLRILIIFFFLFNVYLFSDEIDLTNYPKNPDEVNSYLEFAKTYAPSDSAIVALQRISNFYLKSNNLTKAKEVFTNHLELFNKNSHFINKIIKLFERNDQKTKLINLGTQINSNSDEFMPVPTMDGNYLYYSTNQFQRKLGDEIMVAEFDKRNNKWLQPQSIGNPISTAKNEALLSISSDGNNVMLFGNYPGSIGNGDIFTSQKSFKGWSNVKVLPYPINTYNFEGDATLLADNKTLIFVSDRAGGIGDYISKDAYANGSYWGNTDIYISQKTNDGWSKPINLGNKINTKYSERFPYLHPDMKTLYFCSNGHPGIGNMDIYKSERLHDSSWNEWSEPVNAGKYINTGEDETAFILTSSGDIAFIVSSIENSKNGKDIYTVKVPEFLKPSSIFTISGDIHDSLGFNLNAKVLWFDLKTGILLGETQSNPQSGFYKIFLPKGKTYKLIVEKAFYHSDSLIVEIPSELQKNDSIINFKLVPEKIDLNNFSSDQLKKLNDHSQSYFSTEALYFNTGSYTFNEDSLSVQKELNELISMLLLFKDVNIRLSGFTDSQGDENKNLELSIKRAEMVANFFIKKGITDDRIFVTGYGESNPIANNETADGRKKNRRVEYNLMK